MNERYIPFINEGQVVKTDDPDQMGRVKVWVPALDGEFFEIEALPWADYASPVGGFTVDYPGGTASTENASESAYGWWAIPKMGATVYVFCLGGDATRRVYFASSQRLHRNRSLPAGRNFDGDSKEGPWGDAGDGKGKFNPIEPAYTNLRKQFKDKMTESEARTRGVYERQVAQPKYDKDGKEGYSKTPIDGQSYLDPQTSCFITPGRHGLIFQDDPTISRLRIKTGEGHQMIMDDANERIYMSTAQGNSYWEMDQDGHIHVFGAQSISFYADVDINFSAKRNINFRAQKQINVISVEEGLRIHTAKDIHVMSATQIFISACTGIDMNSEQGIKLSSESGMDLKSNSYFAATASGTLDLTAGPSMKLSAGRIDLNGGAGRAAAKAACAEKAEKPPIVPAHEPWKRPVVKGAKRGKNWKA